MLLQKWENWKRSKDCRDGLHHLPKSAAQKTASPQGGCQALAASSTCHVQVCCSSWFTSAQAPAEMVLLLLCNLCQRSMLTCSPSLLKRLTRDLLIVPCISTLSSLTLSVFPLPKVPSQSVLLLAPP